MDHNHPIDDAVSDAGSQPDSWGGASDPSVGAFTTTNYSAATASLRVGFSAHGHSRVYERSVGLQCIQAAMVHGIVVDYREPEEEGVRGRLMLESALLKLGASFTSIRLIVTGAVSVVDALSVTTAVSE